MMDKEQLEQLKKIPKFQDDYVLKLAISDHIDELKLKEDYMKMKDIPKGTNEYRNNYRKELADLYILLTLYYEMKGYGRVETRAEKILEKNGIK